MTLPNDRGLRVLALCVFPIEGAATRFRVEQFVGPLRDRGVEMTVSPFLDSRQFRQLYRKGGVAGKAAGMIGPVLRRLGEVFTAGRYDAVFVQREAMLFGPGVVEWLMANIGGRPLVLDLDDATYVRYVSPTYGRIGSFFKFFGKTDNLIKRASAVVCGNRFIAEYAGSKGAKTVVVPTVVDLDEFRPRDLTPEGETVTLGWIGTPSTFPSLESIFPVLERLAKKHRFVLKVVGAGRDEIRIDGVTVENLEWELGRELSDFRSLDVGLYPIVTSRSADERWLQGKSGFKAIQYLAVGIPFAMSPVGVCAEIGEANVTHFNAESAEDWYNSLDELLSDGDLRSRMGAAGRKHALANYGLEKQADLLAEVLKDVVRRK